MPNVQGARIPALIFVVYILQPYLRPYFLALCQTVTYLNLSLTDIRNTNDPALGLSYLTLLLKEYYFKRYC